MSCISQLWKLIDETFLKVNGAMPFVEEISDDFQILQRYFLW